MYSSRCPLKKKKGLFRFGKKGKLAPRYIGPLEVIKVVGRAAYQLQLPAQWSEVHDVFHISMLRKCLSDAMPVVNLEDIEVQDGVTDEEQPVRILDTKKGASQQNHSTSESFVATPWS